MAKHSYDPNWKLRVVVDESLPAGAVCAQALHAAIEFVLDHRELTSEWYELSNSVVILTASADQLQKLQDRCKTRELQYSLFEEPDLDDQLTAICVEPTREGKRVTSNYRLALRGL